jgi:hypothetical protein
VAGELKKQPSRFETAPEMLKRLASRRQAVTLPEPARVCWPGKIRAPNPRQRAGKHTG